MMVWTISFILEVRRGSVVCEAEVITVRSQPDHFNVVFDIVLYIVPLMISLLLFLIFSCATLLKVLLKGTISYHKKKKSTISQILTELLQFFSWANFFLEISRFSFSKLDMAITQSFLKIQSSIFFANIPIFYVEKDFALKLGGHRQSCVVIFGRWPALEGQIRGTPPKNFKFFSWNLLSMDR